MTIAQTTRRAPRAAITSPIRLAMRRFREPGLPVTGSSTPFSKATRSESLLDTLRSYPAGVTSLHNRFVLAGRTTTDGQETGAAIRIICSATQMVLGFSRMRRNELATRSAAYGGERLSD